ncbi:hypothetical protein AcetOrient_orf01977 [Acetobacter orientalis]|uniref:Uncharacterized protein n=1 Tax=Acetobacter orientalis TaxID=146474 RepID=A0A2Z5ZHL2_9PROT|nr:hypothetical protein AcetOrient_orf01977 [Acetobacter orientalis]
MPFETCKYGCVTSIKRASWQPSRAFSLSNTQPERDYSS